MPRIEVHLEHLKNRDKWAVVFYKDKYVFDYSKSGRPVTLSILQMNLSFQHCEEKEIYKWNKKDDSYFLVEIKTTST